MSSEGLGGPTRCPTTACAWLPAAGQQASRLLLDTGRHENGHLVWLTAEAPVLRPRAAQNSARWHSTRDGMNVLTALSVRLSEGAGGTAGPPGPTGSASPALGAPCCLWGAGGREAPHAEDLPFLLRHVRLSAWDVP